jgi:hypothetical protein
MRLFFFLIKENELLVVMFTTFFGGGGRGDWCDALLLQVKVKEFRVHNTILQQHKHIHGCLTAK